MKPIRNSARALIMNGNQILVTKNKDDFGIFYMFPGGGQDKGEPLSATVVRECLEEVGVQVIPGNMVCIREYIGDNHEFVEWDHDFHQVEFYFICTMVAEGSKSLADYVPTNPDPDQIGVEWMELNQLKSVRIYPKTLAHMFSDYGVEGLPKFYVGDVN